MLFEHKALKAPALLADPTAMCIAAGRSWLKRPAREAGFAEKFGDAGNTPDFGGIRHTNSQVSPVQRQLSEKPPRKITPVSIMRPVTTNRMTKPMSIIRDLELFFSSPNFLLFPIA